MIRTRTAMVVGLLWVATLGLAACTGGDADNGVPTAGGPATTAAGPDSGTQEREFVACMRREGIADMPDPIPGDTSGRSAVKYAIDVLGKGSDEAFQTALEKCRSLLPTMPDGGSTVEASVYRPFAVCMRDNGVTDFPDPVPGRPFGVMLLTADSAYGVVGGPGARFEDYVKLDLAQPAVKAAYEKCKSTLPAPPD